MSHLLICTGGQSIVLCITLVPHILCSFGEIKHFLYRCFTFRLFQRHSRTCILLLLLQECSLEVFAELKKDAVLALEFILKGSSVDFTAVRGLLPLMSDYQLDLLSDEVSYVVLALRLVDRSCVCMYQRESIRGEISGLCKAAYAVDFAVACEELA